MKTIQITSPGAFALVEKELPLPGPFQVRIKVKATGICHSDSYTVLGTFPGVTYPRIPGHEIAGIIDAVGQGVYSWKKDQRVGVGWAGIRCRRCQACRRGDFILCQNHQITGIHYDGGYAEYMIASVESLAALPDEISFEEAAPLLCAGVTTFNALRNSQARPGDLVAIQSIGGLGHLAIQFANKMGFKTVAISKGAEKEELAVRLGAHIYINSEKENAAEELSKLNGAKVILATAPSGKAISTLIDGLGNNGQLLVVGSSNEPIQVTSMQLIRKRCAICGWPSGTAFDSENALQFCAQTGIRPMIETFALEKAQEAYQHMMDNKARFRSVLKFD
ncbi:MAG: alcohol dehydrogenase catalytic domain-containing protein [Proteobacteria bacterium]|nr:alcohol dehydrogenase catalytic domain-containing protein [Pseudomonadota bacterium]